ncbi:hypothetical protein BJ944DRAFT_231832 [Cunninghamella echinulata]|nr:hypothetical protein BJ944DRAFT_231832 [Cunninghamella echinulata]
MLHNDILPNETLRLILLELKLKQRYRLAITCRTLWMKIRMFPLNITYHIISEESISSFFTYNITSISINIRHSNCLKLNDKKKILDILPMLTKVYFEDSQYIISIKQATAIVKALSSSDRIIKIYVSNQMMSVFEVAIKITKSFSIVKIKSIPQPTNIISTSRKRGCLDESVDEENEYELQQLNDIQILDKLTSKESIDMVMNSIAPKIIESIFFAKTMWYFATQFELYERDAKLIDDCAIEQNYYPTSPSPTAIIHKKTDKGKSWNELSIFWGTHELLITGGLAGTTTGVVGITAFLGPSLPILIPSFNSSKVKTLVRIRPADFIQRERRLRNYGKYAAGYKWSYHSKLFTEKVSKSMKKKDINKAIVMFKSTSIALKNIDLNYKKMTIAKLNKEKKKLKNNNDELLATVLYKLNKFSSNRPTDALTNEEILSLYKTKMLGYCKRNDEKIIKNKLYLR